MHKHVEGGSESIMSFITSFTIVDDDTGNYITYFVRRGKPYLWLRDKRKRFLRRLDFIEVRAYIEVRYSREEAKKRNPIYVDTVGMVIIKPEDIMAYGLEHVRKRAMDESMEYHREKFGSRIMRITHERGWEHGSIRKGIEDYGQIYLHTIWARTLEDLEKGIGEEDEDVRSFTL
jgi:hypothetical protein